MIYNVPGYVYFTQEQIDLVIRNYEEAIQLYEKYVIAFNHLANANKKTTD
ncbi:MAG: hypothetical protein ACTMUB_01915 [cyanobacterium endosymbiont of Rhopalodia musculus]|nr:hypothetical protein [cyanobacterium endosymbiont of Epithemia clementina EcSB]WGT66995.1 hypothetical protein P3F56_07095 [cyanobacterium endosymbiont of Epithemia clementina EcSB]